MSPVTLCCIQILCLASFVACHKSSQRLRNGSLARGKCKADAKEPWTYRGENGPRFWGDTYPECNGNKQSPIAISSRRANKDPDLVKLSMNNYDIPVAQSTIENNGHTVKITPTDGVERTIVVGDSTYRLLHMHFHWGDVRQRGSEHTLDGTQYTMELHLVHQNSNDELAVVGVFFRESRSKNKEIETMIKYFPKVLYKDNMAELTSNLNLNNLVPENPSSYYRYAGSLTTPDCAGGVTWSVLPKPLRVGRKQMAEFRKLYTSTKADASPNCKISNNFRPLQPLKGREVFKSQ